MSEDTALPLTPDQARRAQRAGTAQGATSSQQKHQAAARGLSKQRISQEVLGDPTGAVARFYDVIASYAANPRTDPSPLLLEALVLFKEERAAHLSVEQLAVSFDLKLARHLQHQTAKDIALQEAFRGVLPLPGLLKAVRRSCWTQLSLIVDGEGLVSRGILDVLVRTPGRRGH